MHYLIREEFWALGDDFKILDEKQQLVMFQGPNTPRGCKPQLISG